MPKNTKPLAVGPPAASQCSVGESNPSAIRPVFFARALRVVFLRRMIGASVVLIPVDVAAHLILLVVHLGMFPRRQVAAIRGAVVAHFIVDVRFLVLQVAGFPRSQLPRPHALPDTRLLISFAG